MIAVNLPVSCQHIALIQSLHTSGALDGGWDHAQIHIPPRGFIPPAAVAFLCAWGLKQLQARRKLEFSGDPDVLLSIDKKIDHDTIRQAFKNAKQVGLETIGFFIIGLPGETEETMDRTIEFACEVDPLIANFSMMTPYPGTKVYEIAKRQGRLLLTDWEDYVFFDGRARYELGDMTADLVERKWKEAYRRFYLRPHRIAKTLARKDFWLNWRRTFRVAYNTLLPKKEKTELRKTVEAEVTA